MLVLSTLKPLAVTDNWHVSLSMPSWKLMIWIHMHAAHLREREERENASPWNGLEVEGGVGMIIVGKIIIIFLYLTLARSNKQLAINFWPRLEAILRKKKAAGWISHLFTFVFVEHNLTCLRQLFWSVCDLMLNTPINREIQPRFPMTPKTTCASVFFVFCFFGKLWSSGWKSCVC